MKAKSSNVNFYDLVNFKDQQRLNPEQLWSEKGRKFSAPKPKFVKNSNMYMTESKLLQSALTMIRNQKQKSEAEALEDIISQSSSNFVLSRQNTPANHIFPKRKIKHKTMTSDLFDIESKGSQAGKKDHNMFEDLILYPRLIGLSDLVYQQVMGKEKKINAKLMHTWKDCLYPEDKQQIYGPNAPYSFSRIFPINELQKGFHDIYGSGKKRCLRVGEQSLLISHMGKYLQKCSKQVMKIARKDYDIINHILKSAKMQQLQQFPTCMKQVELIWKILATQWRYSGKLDLKNKLLQGALINGRSNFLDLKKQNAVTAFLLSSSNQNQGLNQKN